MDLEGKTSMGNWEKVTKRWEGDWQNMGWKESCRRFILLKLRCLAISRSHTHLAEQGARLGQSTTENVAA